MTTWTVKSLTGDLNRALQIVQEQQNRGDDAWIEDEDGRKLDDAALKKSNDGRVNRSRYDWLIAILYIGGTITIGLGGLYLLGLWVDGDL